MTDPVTMLAGASAATGLFGAVSGASGAAESGADTQAADNYRAQVARNNAQIAQQNATDEMGAGETAAYNSELGTKAKVGSQIAAQGANGIDVNSGSAAAVRAGTSEVGMTDALTIRSNAARKAYGYEVQGVNDTNEAQLDTMAGQNAQKEGDINADTSLLSGASTVARSLSPFYNQGGFSSKANLGA